ncbi:hypothetical protein Y032_0053g2370 [Ancylostoma ceylanicum]|uniref:Uncharacterized protein n=1 Tax=Ancylostoma ceylanicum TaxID=53326 RepID=A0A016U7U3_9BILA|nr:hypothetical protein Y032_0053g2370 [Ancylostoma ceylanicum]
MKQRETRRKTRNEGAVSHASTARTSFPLRSKGFEFTFPNIFPDDDENAELQKVKEQQKKMTLNSSFANRDRNKVGEFYGV